MLSKNKIKYIHSLELKKNRKAEGAFIAEGPKLVGDLLGKFECTLLVSTAEWKEENSNLVNAAHEFIEVSQAELSKASLLKTPQKVLAIFKQPNYTIHLNQINESLSLMLDGVQDPGNLGTIVRIADWFGIENIYCSKETADIYNPKTVQATMGAIARVKVHYTNLNDFIESLPNDLPIYGTLLEGENIYSQQLTENGIIVMGNEGKGISPEIRNHISHKLLIPNYPADRETSESLNVAVATSIVCAEFRRPK